MIRAKESRSWIVGDKKEERKNCESDRDNYKERVDDGSGEGQSTKHRSVRDDGGETGTTAI